jgi:predicted TIM-barrel fold metal-dependent hydrolase
VRVDLHTHYLPPRYFELMSDAGALESVESFTVFGPMLRGGSEALFAGGPAAVVENWTEQLDGSEMDLAVMSVGAIQPYFHDEATAVRIAREANMMMREATELSHGRLAAFGSLPLPHPDAALAELAFCLDECGFAGINLGTSARGNPLDAAMFEELWAALDERRASVFIHPGTTPLMAPGSGEFHLAPDFCSPTETAVALCRLIVNGVMSRYRNIQIIAVAMGGALPFFAHRFDAGIRRSDPERYEQLGGILPQLRRLWYDTSMTDEPFVFESVRHSLGVDRLVFGSDLPRGPIADVLKFVVSSPLLDEPERRQLLDINGARALGFAEGFATPA